MIGIADEFHWVEELCIYRADGTNAATISYPHHSHLSVLMWLLQITVEENFCCRFPFYAQFNIFLPFSMSYKKELI